MKGKRSHGPNETPLSDHDHCHAAVHAGFTSAASREQDPFLPIANVSRIMKKSLPANAKISKEAKETVQKCVSEFISFITGEASDKCQVEKRKTINGDDLLWAMTTLGFDNYVGPLKAYLNKYREVEGDKTSMARPGDQSPNEDDNNNSDNNSNVASVPNFNNLYSFGQQTMATQVVMGGGGGCIDIDGYNVGNGASADRVFAGHQQQHPGVQWYY